MKSQMSRESKSSCLLSMCILGFVFFAAHDVELHAAYLIVSGREASLSNQSISARVTGRVTNKKGEPVIAGISFTNVDDPRLVYRDSTDVSGYYELSLDVITTVENRGNPIPSRFSLEQNYPNPFNPGTVIEFSLEKPGNVRLTIYNSLGQKVKELLSQDLSSGDYQTHWAGDDHLGRGTASGVYFYQLTAGSISLTKKMIKLDSGRLGISSFRQVSSTDNSSASVLQKTNQSLNEFRISISGDNISEFSEPGLTIVSDTTIDRVVNSGPIYLGGLNDAAIDSATVWERDLNAYFRNDDQSIYTVNSNAITVDGSTARWISGSSSDLTDVIFQATDPEDGTLVAISLPVDLTMSLRPDGSGNLIQGQSLVGVQLGNRCMFFKKTDVALVDDNFQITGYNQMSFIISGLSASQQFSLSVNGVSRASEFTNPLGLLVFSIEMTQGETAQVRIRRL